MVSLTNHKTVFCNPLKCFLFISLLLINSFFFTSSAFPGELNKALRITTARAETGDTGGNTANINESLKISFDPETRIMDVGAEEAVTLRLEGGGTESFTVTLHSSNPDIVLPVSTSITFSAESVSNSIIVRAVKEGSATITAIVGRGPPPPTKPWKDTEELPSTGGTPTFLHPNVLDDLEDINGFRRDHAQRMNKFARKRMFF